MEYKKDIQAGIPQDISVYGKNLLDAFAIQLRNGFGTELDIAKTKITPLIEEYRDKATTQEQKTKLCTYENYLSEINKFEELLQCIYDQINYLTYIPQVI